MPAEPERHRLRLRRALDRERVVVDRHAARSSHRRAQPFDVGNGPEAVAIGYGSVWVANSLDGTVSRIDPRQQRRHVGDHGRVGPVVGARERRRDLGRRQLRRPGRSHRPRDERHRPARSALGSGPQSLASLGGRVWVSTRERPRPSTAAAPCAFRSELPPTHSTTGVGYAAPPGRCSPPPVTGSSGSSAWVAWTAARSSRTSRPRSPTHGRRPHLYLPAAARHPLLQRRPGARERLPARARARLPARLAGRHRLR